MVAIFEFGQTIINSLLSFSNTIIRAFKSPFYALPVFLGVPIEDNAITRLWAIAMRVLGFVDENAEVINNASTAEVLLGPLLGIILAIGIFKFLKDTIF